MILLSLICAIAAFALFGLAMDAHHQQRLGGRPSPQRKRRLRIAACLALAGGAPFAIASRGWIFGPVVWSGEIMLGAAIVFLALNFLPAQLAMPRKPARTGQI